MFVVVRPIMFVCGCVEDYRRQTSRRRLLVLRGASRVGGGGWKGVEGACEVVLV